MKFWNQVPFEWLWNFSDIQISSRKIARTSPSCLKCQLHLDFNFHWLFYFYTAVDLHFHVPKIGLKGNTGNYIYSSLCQIWWILELSHASLLHIVGWSHIYLHCTWIQVTKQRVELVTFNTLGTVVNWNGIWYH